MANAQKLKLDSNVLTFNVLNETLTTKLIEKLYKLYGNESRYIIKTIHEDKHDIMYMFIAKCANGVLGIINNHLHTDYNNYIITEIAKLDIE